MVLFIAYAFLILWLVAKNRRRWLGLVWLVAGLLGVVAFGYFHYLLSVWTDGFVSLPLLQAMLYPFGGFILFLSSFIYCIPRRAEPHVCRSCEYDLTGQEESPALCPECGLAHSGEIHPAAFCASCGRTRAAAGGGVCPCAAAVALLDGVEESEERRRRRRRAARSIVAARLSPAADERSGQAPARRGATRQSHPGAGVTPSSATSAG